MDTIPENAELYLDETRGQYIPRDFFNETLEESINWHCSSDTRDWILAACANPENECYWEAWTSACDRDTLTVTNTTDGTEYYLLQDGDLWIVPLPTYQVIVGNIGTVYDGTDADQAEKDYHEYCELSYLQHGRASGEVVTLMCDGEIEKDYTPPTQTFYLTEHESELIHRVFGGTKIKPETVRTVNTGGGFMHDLYDTECGHIVAVYEYGALFCLSIEHWEDSDYAADFGWGEPLHVTERDAVAREYEYKIGYNPFDDDPTMPTAKAKAIIAEHDQAEQDELNS